MTREEQIDWLCRLRADLNNGIILTPWNKEFTEALNDVLEQEPCDDCISRKAVLENAINVPIAKIVTEDKVICRKVIFADDIEKLPSVTPQPKTGHWITKDGKEQGYDIGGIKTWYIQIMCSECGFIKTAIEGHIGQYHYCPNCGAKMQEVEE